MTQTKRNNPAASPANGTGKGGRQASLRIDLELIEILKQAKPTSAERLLSICDQSLPLACMWLQWQTGERDGERVIDVILGGDAEREFQRLEFMKAAFSRPAARKGRFASPDANADGNDRSFNFEALR